MFLRAREPQERPSRPRPAVCSSARTAVPTGPPRSASARAASWVEEVVWRQRGVRPSGRGRTRRSPSARSSMSAIEARIAEGGNKKPARGGWFFVLGTQTCPRAFQLLHQHLGEVTVRTDRPTAVARFIAHSYHLR